MPHVYQMSTSPHYLLPIPRTFLWTSDLSQISLPQESNLLMKNADILCRPGYLKLPAPSELDLLMENLAIFVNFRFHYLKSLTFLTSKRELFVKKF